MEGALKWSMEKKKEREKRIRIHRSKDLKTTVLQVSGSVARMQLTIHAPLSARQRRIVAVSFMRQIRPWLQFFSYAAIHHLEHSSFQWAREAQVRGVSLFRSGHPTSPSGEFGLVRNPKNLKPEIGERLKIVSRQELH